MRPLLAALILAALAALAFEAVAQPPAKDGPGEKKGKRDPPNLVPNGDFEDGTDTPDHWQVVDGLTTFWVKGSDPKRGKVIAFDTDVYQKEGYDWWVKIAGGARAKDAPKKTPTRGDKYDTLAGLDGVWYWSDFIPVVPGKAYWLTMDVKGPDILAWLVGYEKKESNAFGADANAFQEYLKEKKLGKPLDRKRNFEGIVNKYIYRGQLNSRFAEALPNGWRRYRRDKQTFTPTRVTPSVRFVRVLVFPFWPPGKYYVDNVRLTEVAAGK